MFMNKSSNPLSVLKQPSSGLSPGMIRFATVILPERLGCLRPPRADFRRSTCATNETDGSESGP